MRFSDKLWIEKWSNEPLPPIVKNYNGVVVGTDAEPNASLCMSSFAEAMGDKFREGVKLLDYGCGSSRFCNFMSKRLINFEYYGVERNISEYTTLCVETAKNLFGHDERFKIGYTDSDFEISAINACDVVLLLSVFTHTTIEMTHNIIERLMPVLDKNNGIIVFSMIHQDTYKLIGNAYGFNDEYSVTYNTTEQIEDIRKKFNVNVELVDTFFADGNITHSIYRMYR